jgi:hypothetical protein
MTKGYIQAASDTMLHHLQVCSLVPELIRNRASSARQQSRSAPYSASPVIPTPLITGASSVLQLETNSAPIPAFFHAEVRPELSTHPLSPLDPFSPALPGPSTLFSPLDNNSDAGSIPGSSVASFSSTPAFPQHQISHGSHIRVAGLCRSFSQPPVHFHDPIVPTIPFSADCQACFESRLCRVVASAGLPLSLTSNVEWLLLVDEFMPGVQNIKRNALTRRVLPSILWEHRKQAKASVRGCDATVQCDGWSGLNGHHLIAFMISSNNHVSTKSGMIYS